MANRLTQRNSKCCYLNWIAQQQLDLVELLESINIYPADANYLKVIIDKVVCHFDSYIAARGHLARHDGSTYFAPAWGSTFQNSFLWIGGCRPSMIIRIVYVLCGRQLNAHIVDILQGVTRGNLAEISSCQLKAIDALHARTIKEENNISSQMATVQERLADEPLVSLALLYGESRTIVGVDEAMNERAFDQYGMLLEADKLRMNILKSMLEILTPLQGVEFLVAAKKLHLSLHEWSKKRQLGVPCDQRQPANTNNASSSNHPPPPEN